MDLEATKKFLLVKTVEEADREGAIIPLDERSIFGTEEAGDEILLGRAEKIHNAIAAEHPRQMHAVGAATASHQWLKIAVVVAAFLIGLATKQLGAEPRINILAFPLFGVIAWNLLFYLVSFVGKIFRKKSGPATTLLSGLVNKLAERGMRKLEAGGDQVLATGLSRFVGLWYQLTTSIRIAHARGCLHMGAAALCLGIVAGMYWNGLASQYLAVWESTFLSPEAVQQLFTNLFAPASAISGLEVPGLAEIRSMEVQAGGKGAPAAIWIHLFAITVGLFVVLPRLVMAISAQRLAGKLERAINFRDAAPGYVEQLMKTREGGNLIARVFPHRMELGSKERDRLRGFVHQLWGGQLWVEFADPISYGDEDEASFEKADYQMLVLNFSATPEEESQGRLVKRFKEQLSERGLVVLEAAPFRERFGGLGEFDRRLDERHEAWRSILGKSKIGFAILDDDIDKTRLAAQGALLEVGGKRDV